MSGMDIDRNAIETFMDELPDKAANLGIRVVIAFILTLVLLKVISMTIKLMRKAMTKMNADEGMINFLSSLVSVALKILLAFGILASFGMPTASIVALLGSAGLAIGLALQGSLSNLAGGVMILLLKPFRIGDYIREDTKGHEGIVYEIGLFNTKLRTYDNKLIVLPNGNLANTSLTNMTGNTERMLEVKVGIAYDSNIAKAKQVLLDVVNSFPHALEGHPIDVYVDSLGESAVVLGVRCWVETVNFLKRKWDMNERIKIALDENGITIPFNQLDVHMKQD